MIKKNEVYVCPVCKSEVIATRDAGGTLVCCGKPMQLQVIQTVEALAEKHIPVVSIENGLVKVQVGSVLHPMIDVHHIEWIAYLNTQGEVQFTYLKIGNEPKAVFNFKGAGTVYSYCNLHGLWKADLK